MNIEGRKEREIIEREGDREREIERGGKREINREGRKEREREEIEI